MTLDMRELIDELESSSSSKKGLHARVTHEINKLGFEWEDRPTRNGKNYVPRIPHTGITSLSDEEAMDLYGEFAVMEGYVGEQLIQFKVLAKDYEKTLKRMISTIRLKTEGTASERDDKAKTHSKVIKMEDSWDVAKGVVDYLQQKLDDFHEKGRVCSRDMERRRKEMDSSVREASLRGMKRSKGKVRSPITQDELEVD